uniref:NLR family CARD domain-containing protein 3-like isoform X2 n=1 Tax=Scatophagus argus TaxID=75038 RepID=UPI001ED80BE5|nr:NLR family CARD domain-containing protein 3-like isoform X2 [Scatophagus argus]XP_046271084.1 NLR family CARD domain-containing protein 3-like isoform X2 [Scatophagus argus]XP_046271085.1 NLR family CARD domain-containing protein 3-like isoform X2 [Scatophagus argus]XP_046271086.1 NLR family CARD domain-containing protein 3-like isoform X2 [Scatophagus argus]
MGSQCSTLRKTKRKKDQEKDELSTRVENGETSSLLHRQPSLQKNEEVSKEATEDTLRRNDDEEVTSCHKQGCGEKSRALPHVLPQCTAVGTPRSSLSELCDPASTITEEKHANWVDNNRAKLIQSVTLVMVIADEMIQQKIIHNETYSKIKAAGTTQEQMRELYGVLTTTKAKSAFYRILKDIQPEICESEDIIKEVIKKHKEYLKEKFRYEFEGIEKDQKDAKSLYKIYTELHIIQGESEHVNYEHEIWEIEDKTKSQTYDGTKINCNEIFGSIPVDNMAPGQDRREVRAIRTVMTKGIAGIGKTVSVKKFILDWADGKANRGLDFIFVLPFRELNLVKEDQFSLETLVKDFHPELKNTAVARIFNNHKVLFIFDGLDESQLNLHFKETKKLSDATQKSSVDTLVTNLIREHLLPSAFVWITSRPGAVHLIPRQYVYLWTEVRGFNDEQKKQYFRKRIEDKAIAERIINNIMMSRSLYIMCHIPIFCWLAAKVLVYLLLKMDNTQEENIKIPTTLTEMYTHFLSIQMQVATEKYDIQNEFDTEEIFISNEEFIFKLGRMAFEYLKEGKIIFTGNDLKNYDIDIRKAGVHCGLCTEILKEENVFHTRKLYCFVHLTVQEYFAALFVYRSFASKKIHSLSLKDFLLIGSEEHLKPILDADPVDLPLNELMEISIANSTLRKTGELDMFLRFLIGMSARSTQELLQGLIQQTEEHSEVVEEIRTSLIEIDLGDCSPERCLNLVHCLMELKDSSLHDMMQQYLKPNHYPETQLSPVQCSVLADCILMSNRPLDDFDLKKYRPSAKGLFRLLPAVRNCRKARISGVDLTVWPCETISSALRMPNSVLTELHMINSIFYDEGTKILIDGLMDSQCTLKALSLSGYGHSQEQKMASAIRSVFSNLRELELSGNILGGSLCPLLSDGLGQLEKLILNRNANIVAICKKLETAFTSNPCYLQALELSYTSVTDTEMEILCSGLMSTNCNLGTLSLSHNRLTEKGCKTLASALSSKPSSLTELDLSYNDLQDPGVKALCSALMNPYCALKTLRLSFCKVTGDGCASLTSALRSDHCSLRELDLSFNHLEDSGVKVLTEIQSNSCYSLEKLSVEQSEECWFDLKLLRKYACDLTLDPKTAGINLLLTEKNKKATFVQERQSYPDNPERFHCRQVLCEEGLSGRHYWEVECVSADVGVAYKSIDRNGDASSEFSLGKNENSWCWFSGGRIYHNNSEITVSHSTHRSTIGVYLDWPLGILSFFEVFPDTLTHLYTVHTTFTEPLHPGFHLGDGSIYICKIK